MNRKIVLVSGGTGGIGTATCKRLSSEYQVIASYYHNGQHDGARKWQEELQREGYTVDLAYGNLAVYSDCEKMVNDIKERYGRIDVLVNNAGITQDSSFRKMTEEQWHEVIDTNLNGVFNLTRNVLPLMLENQYGRIISISSINGRKGQFGQANYAATKSALYGFSKSIAQEVAKKNITVNTISPGYIDTHMLATVGEEIMKAIIAEIPVGRLGRPEEIAEAIAFLASEHAAFITGANLDANGGQYM